MGHAETVACAARIGQVGHDKQGANGGKAARNPKSEVKIQQVIVEHEFVQQRPDER